MSPNVFFAYTINDNFEMNLVEISMIVTEFHIVYLLESILLVNNNELLNTQNVYLIKTKHLNNQ